METVKEIISNPVVVTLLIEIAILILAKIDPSNRITRIIKAFAHKLET